MTYKTHILGGVLAGLLVSKAVGLETKETIIITTGISGVISLLPDIDIPNSKIGKKLRLISEGINDVFGHRGLFHSPFLYLLIGFFLRNTLPLNILISCLAGIGSHLLLDMFNSAGIPIFYPISKQRISIARIKTRSFEESIFALLLLVSLIIVAYNMFNNSNVDFFSLIQEKISTLLKK